jgi:hypothetical protein
LQSLSVGAQALTRVRLTGHAVFKREYNTARNEAKVLSKD